MSAVATLVVFAGCAPSPGSRDLPSETGPPQQTAAVPAADSGYDSQETAGGAIRFTDMTRLSGLSFEYVNDEEAGHFSPLETVGGGVALADFDCDGRLDVILAGGGRFGPDDEIHGVETAYFRSTGSWTFINATEEARIATAPHYSHGIIAADYNNDGFTDVLVTGYGGLRLFRNCGDGTFEDVTIGAGLTDVLWSSSAGWGDINGDGSPDLYVAHYLNWTPDNDPKCRTNGQRDVCPPRLLDGLPDVLYNSNGDGTFHDTSEANGLKPDGKGLGVLIADLDVDGDLDIYVANDTVPNFLYRNDGLGRLSDEAPYSGTSVGENGVPEGSMGVAMGDYNRDGLPDLCVANFENESYSLYRNDGNMLFQHVSRAVGITSIGALYVGWGTAFVDADRDGCEDLIAVNGHVIRNPINAPVLQKPLLLHNRDSRRFVNVVETAGDLNRDLMGRGLAIGDIDADGDPDVLISCINESCLLLSNETADDHNWFGIRLIGTTGSRDAVGARVRLKPDSGAEQFRQVHGGGSYASTSAPELFFGLGHSARIDEIEVHWPSGNVSRSRDLHSGQRLTFVESRPQPIRE